MGRILSIIAATSLAALPIQAAAQDAPEEAPQRFEPSSQWVVDYGDDYCRLIRSFSNGEDEISLAFERIHPAPSLRLILIGDVIRMYRRALTAGYSYTPDGAERTAFVLRSKTADRKQFLNFGDIAMAPPLEEMAAVEPGAPLPLYDRGTEQEYASEITGLLLDEGLVKPIHLETGSLKGAIGAIQACNDELLTVWGLDSEKHQAMTRAATPAGDATKWLPGGIIPFGEFEKLGGGANILRIMVDAAGKPAACKIHWPSLSEHLNTRLCDALMEKAEFQPALDGLGATMASYWVTSPMALLPPPPGR